MANHHNRNLHIAEMALQGLSQTDIGKAVGLTRQRISDILNNDEICRAAIEDGQKAQIAMLPIAINKHAAALQSEDEKIVLSAAALVYKNVGITPSHTQAPLIGRLTINQQNNIASPEIIGLLADVFRSKHSETLDVKPIDEGKRSVSKSE